MSADVIVVGGGAIGVCVAHEVARTGRAVTLLERGGALAGECSSGNGGIVSPSHATPLASPELLREALGSLAGRPGSASLRLRRDTIGWFARYARSSGARAATRGRALLRELALASLELHEELAALGTGLTRRGTVDVYETPQALAAAHGRDGTPLTSEGVHELVSALAPGVAGGRFHEDEAHVEPVRFAEAVAEAARRAGAELRTGAEVVALRRDGGSIEVGLGSERLRAPTVVLAGGVWTAGLARRLGVSVPLVSAKGHHVDFAPAAGDPEIPLLLHETRIVVSPFPDRLRVAGRIAFTGLDGRVEPDEVEAIRADAVRVLPGLEARPILDTWAGLRPATPDGLPVIGRPGGFPELVVASGHAMKGVALAPVTGRLVAELVAGEPPSVDLEPFSPDRFRRLLRRR